MKLLQWVGRFPTSVLDEVYYLVKKVPGTHRITLVNDDEILLVSDNAFDMDVAVESDVYLFNLVR